MNLVIFLKPLSSTKLYILFSFWFNSRMVSTFVWMCPVF